MRNLQPHSNTLIHDKEYKEWIAELSKRFMQSQVKAAVRVNQEMLRFYWSLGKDIEERQFDNKYGSHFYENLSRDLISTLHVKKGFSPSTLYYTKYFYKLYAPLFDNFQQPAEDLIQEIHQQPADYLDNTIFQQPAEEFNLLFSIPWSHHQKIIDKVQGDSKKAMFFVRKTWENQWGRGVLLNFLDTDLYERQGQALSNFQATLPAVESDLAQQLLKDPYRFEFVQLNEKYSEIELKDELMNKLSQFLLELGKGFSFVGREYRLSAGGKDKFIDLLFYVIPLHRYCVIEVKTTEFDFQDIGQLVGYTAMVDDLLNTDKDSPAIGLLICKEKNAVLARYALSHINAPIGISEYELARQQLPQDMQSALPTTDEIESKLNN